jgi:hypothetical protein
MDKPPSLRRPWFNFGRRMSVARWLVVLVGILLPYAVRILGIPSHGFSWFTSYLGNGIDALIFFGAFNAICWGSILLATLTYRHARSVWFPALLGFTALGYYHTTLDLASSSTAAIGLMFIPIDSLPYVLTGGLVGLLFDRLVFTDTATESSPATGQFGLRSLLVVTVAVGIAFGLFAYEKRRIDATMREGMRQGILNGEISPESARYVLGSEVDTLKALPMLTESEIRAAAVAEVARRTSLPSDQFTEETVQRIGGRWRIVVWRLPKTTKDYYVVYLAKSGKVDEFVQATLP